MTGVAGGDRDATPGWRVGHALGVPVYLRPSWLLVAALITVTFLPSARSAVPDAGTAALLLSLGFAVLLLLSVLVHEVAHALAARWVGTPAHHIVLDVWGGHTAFDADAVRPWQGIVVSASGPAANAALAALVWPLMHRSGHGAVHLLVIAFAVSNALVAAFNALPGLPLDGGRVLECLLWWVTGRRMAATVGASWCGRALAAVLVGWAVVPWLGWTGAPPYLRGGLLTSGWLLLVAWMLWHGAGQSVAVARWYRQAELASARALLRPAVSVPSTSTVADALRAAVEAGQGTVAVVLDVYGRPAGVLDESALAEVPDARAAMVPASAVAHVLSPGAVVDAQLAGTALLARLDAEVHPRYAVVDGGPGAVVGVLERQAVARFVGGD